jgi:hypothetical protein
MSHTILSPNPHFTQNTSSLVQQLFPCIGPQSECYHSRNANLKRTLPSLDFPTDITLLTKKIQVSNSESINQTEAQSKSSTQVRDRKSKGDAQTKSKREEKACKKQAAKEGDMEMLLGFIAWYDSPFSQRQSSSEDLSLIGVNLFKTSLTSQTPEESKVEQRACATPKSTKKSSRAKMSRVQSKNNLQDVEESTAQSEQDEQEVLAVETPVKNNALPVVQLQELVAIQPLEHETANVQTLIEVITSAPIPALTDCEDQKIKACPIGENYQVSNQYIESLGSLAPRKTKPKIKYNPEGVHEKVSEFRAKLEESLKVKEIHNDIKLIDILEKQSWDVDKTLSIVTHKDKVRTYQTLFDPNNKNPYGTRSKNK